MYKTNPAYIESIKMLVHTVIYPIIPNRINNNVEPIYVPTSLIMFDTFISTPDIEINPITIVVTNNPAPYIAPMLYCKPPS